MTRGREQHDGTAHAPAARTIAPEEPDPAAGPPAADTDAWIGIEAAASHLAIPVRTMYRLAQLRKVPGVKVGRTWRFRRSSLDAHLERSGPRTGLPEVRPPGQGAADPRAIGAGGQEGEHRPHAALADVSAELASLADPPDIARYLENRLRTLFGADLVGLLRLDGDHLVTLTGTERLGIAPGTRFPIGAGSPLFAALERDEPLVIDDLEEVRAARSEVVGRLGIRSLACVPIRLGDETWGVLALGGLAPRSLTPGEVARLRSIASQASLALHNGRLFRETVRWSEHLERIEALSRQLNRSRDVPAVAEAVASHIDSVIDWHGLRFYLLAPDGRTLEPIKLACRDPHYATHTPERVRLRLGEGLGGHIAASGVAEVINDAAADPRTRRIPGTDDIDESMIVVPLRYEDAVLGVLELFRLGCGAFDATDLRLAQIVGAQASVAIVNARQVEELERRSADLERRLASQRQLLAITERLLLHREGNAVFEAIADTLAEVVPHDTLTIYLVDRAAGCLVPALARDEYATEIMATRPSLGTGVTGDVIAKGEAEIVNDADHDPRTLHVPGTPLEQAEAMIVAPIRTSEGVIGALNLYRAGREFAADDLELVRLFTNHVAIALENASIHDRLVEAAVTDPLTGLPNRRLFTDRVDHALLRRGRAPGAVAVLFLDLDGFKLVNDSLGHAAGDEVLAAVATRLRTCIRAIDTVARLGGDEFAILLEDVQDDADAITAADRVMAALAEPLALPDRTVSVRASLGVAVDRGAVGITAVDLLRNADTAMYQAKSGGRSRVALFEPAMHARQLARLELESELRDALANGEFRLVYQPIVELGSGRVAGAETLLRWDRPAGRLDPQEFIPLAEETGDILAIGRWVLSEACRQASAWRRVSGAADFEISVNTSARELVERSFVDDVTAALRSAGLTPDRLTLEITESVMLADETAAIATLRELRAAGVHVAVDDFGTGYSSLGYLDRLPVDGLKIDRSFVAGLGPGRGKSAIVSATLSFARALGLTVIAEGVETGEQLRRLQELGCGLAQGYLFAAPLSAGAMSDLLAAGRAYPVPRRTRGRRSRQAA